MIEVEPGSDPKATEGAFVYHVEPEPEVSEWYFVHCVCM